jgi:uncharacterized protein (UPF0335 family)
LHPRQPDDDCFTPLILPLDLFREGFILRLCPEKGKDMAKANVKKKDESSNVHEISGNRLKSFIERVERLEEEKKALSEDIRDVYSEAKATGFDSRVMRKVVSLRKMNLEKRREEQELLDLYMSAIGMA